MPRGCEVPELPRTKEALAIKQPEMMWRDQDPSLVLLYGPHSRRFRLCAPGPLVVGRDAACDVLLDWPSVSRRHAELILSDETVLVRDLGSTNGTEVNDTTIQQQQLRDGDLVAAGEVQLRYLGHGVQQCSHQDLLYRETRSDSITTTYSTRHLMSILEREASRAHRYGRPFCVAALGVDGLRQIKERHKTAGIQILRQLALVVRNNIRRADSLARLSHNELAIVLPEIELEGARALAQKLSDLVARTEFVVGDEALEVTISVGVAAHDGSTCNASMVLGRASEKLRRARTTGGSTVAA